MLLLSRSASLVLFALPLMACGEVNKPPVCETCYHFEAGVIDSGPDGGTQPGGFPVSGVGTPGKCDGFGSAMVQVDAPNHSYCIDEYEATIGDYAKFATAAKNARLPAPCDQGFDPGPSPTTMNPGYPTYSVNWCDAVGFCRYAGKRLCGSVERNPDAGAWQAGLFDVKSPATGSEWFYACSNGGTTTYPYGNTFNQATCNAPTINVQPLAKPGQFPNCHGTSSPYSKIFDMAGNVEEWEDNCEQAGTEPAATDLCTLRGGEYKVLLDWDRSTECNILIERIQRRAAKEVAGIRCCKDL